MKKDKEWLKIESAINFTDQLDEPEKPVVPQFVADYIEECKHIGLTMNEWFRFDSDYENEDKTEKWLRDNDHETNHRRELILIDAIRHGYEIERKQYYVIDKTNGSTLMTFELSGIVGEEVVEFVDGYSENETIHFSSKEKAELIANFIGESVEEVTE